MNKRLNSIVASATIALGILVPLKPDFAAASDNTSSSTTSSVYITQQELLRATSQGAKLVDLRTPQEYAVSHIPGAINVPRWSLNIDQKNGLSTELRTDEELEKAFQVAGLQYTDAIILYDARSLAGRGYLAFDHAGFENVRILEGGYSAWKGDLSDQQTNVAPSDFKITRSRPVIVDSEYVLKSLNNRAIKIVDGRSREAFNDGHIPGSLNILTPILLDENGKLRPEDQARGALSKAGVNKDDEVILTCGNGALASSYLAIFKNLGYENVKLYDGSWNEWTAKPDLPRSVALQDYHLNAVVETDVGTSGSKFVKLADVEAALTSAESVVLDIRDAETFYWSERFAGSVNIPFAETVSNDGNLKSRKELEEIFAKAGLSPEKRVIIVSPAGLQVAHTYLLLGLLGYKDVSIYPEGWIYAEGAKNWVNPWYKP